MRVTVVDIEEAVNEGEREGGEEIGKSTRQILTRDS